MSKYRRGGRAGLESLCDVVGAVMIAAGALRPEVLKG